VTEVKIVVTGVFLVAEALPVAVPVESDGVRAHVQQAVFGESSRVASMVVPIRNAGP
jgi:hypothetical protein